MGIWRLPAPCCLLATSIAFEPQECSQDWPTSQLTHFVFADALGLQGQALTTPQQCIESNTEVLTSTPGTTDFELRTCFHFQTIGAISSAEQAVIARLPRTKAWPNEPDIAQAMITAKVKKRSAHGAPPLSVQICFCKKAALLMVHIVSLVLARMQPPSPCAGAARGLMNVSLCLAGYVSGYYK